MIGVRLRPPTVAPEAYTAVRKGGLYRRSERLTHRRIGQSGVDQGFQWHDSAAPAG